MRFRDGVLSAPVRKTETERFKAYGPDHGKHRAHEHGYRGGPKTTPRPVVSSGRLPAGESLLKRRILEGAQFGDEFAHA